MKGIIIHPLIDFMIIFESLGYRFFPSYSSISPYLPHIFAYQELVSERHLKRSHWQGTS